MRYGSVCSGIEAASVAWHPLGWTASFLSEIDKFPRAVLAHHYPAVPLHGDFTTIEAGQYGSIDLLVGGTPCQAFSVAGLRKGLADERGNLTLEFLRLAQRLRPRWLVWENVPGVLSIDGGRTFGTFLGGLGELGYGFAYRILDAQFYGVAQRRRRVFVVGHLGDWRRAAAVLFERESLSGNPAPRQEAGQGTAPTIAARIKGGGGLGTDAECDGALIAHAFDARQSDVIQYGDMTGPLDTDGHSLAIAFSCKDHGADAGDIAPTLRSMGHDGSHANAGGQVAVAFNITPSNSNKDYNARASQRAQAVTAGGNRPSARGGDLIAGGMAVRRLTPRECERLQGFPDDYTLIPYRNKPASDGPRYKALGNSMAVPVMAWIGSRIELVETLTEIAA